MRLRTCSFRAAGRLLTATLVAFCATGTAAAPAKAGDDLLKFRFDRRFDNGFDDTVVAGRRSDRGDLFARIRPTFRFPLVDGLNLVWETTIDSIRNEGLRNTSVAGAHGLASEKLYLRYRRKPMAFGGVRLGGRIFAGKFTPSFGRAWTGVPGLVELGYATDYELKERIGFGVEPELQGWIFGRQSVETSVFFRDTSTLTTPWIGPDGRTRLSDGGVSNTGRLNSFVIAWKGKGLHYVPGLDLQAALAYQSPGQGGTVPEVGVTGSVLYSRDVGGVMIKPFLELVHLTGAGGAEGKDRLYVTASMSAEWRGWTAAVGALVRHATGEDDLDANDVLLTLSAGYATPRGLNLRIAVRYLRETGTTAPDLGVLATVRCKIASAARSFPLSCFGD